MSDGPSNQPSAAPATPGDRSAVPVERVAAVIETIPTPQTIRNAAVKEQRICELTGDRMCQGCGFNLRGQLVVREPHYQMLMVRCPECAVVAALGEYPTLSRWANRWTAAAAVLWALLALAIWLGMGGFMMIPVGMDDWNRKYYGASSLAQLQQTWLAAKEAAKQPPSPSGTTTTAPAPPNANAWMALQPWSSVDPAWWAASDKNSLRMMIRGGAATGSMWSAYRQVGGTAVVIGIGAGALMAALLLGVRQRWLWAVAPALILPMIAYSSLGGTGPFTGDGAWVLTGGTPATFQDAAVGLLGHNAWWATLTWLVLGCAIGLMVGRPLARWVVRLALPPKSRAALAVLWWADGKRVPMRW